MTEDQFIEIQLLAARLQELHGAGRSGEATEFSLALGPLDQARVAALAKAVSMGMAPDRIEIEIEAQMMLLAVIDPLVEVPGGTEDADRELERIRSNFRR